MCEKYRGLGELPGSINIRYANTKIKSNYVFGELDYIGPKDIFIYPVSSM